MKCPNCGHVFEPDEEEEMRILWDYEKSKPVYYPGVELKEKK